MKYDEHLSAGIPTSSIMLILPGLVIVLLGMYLYKSCAGSVFSRRNTPRTTYQEIYELFFYIVSDGGGGIYFVCGSNFIFYCPIFVA